MSIFSSKKIIYIFKVFSKKSYFIKKPEAKDHTTINQRLLVFLLLETCTVFVICELLLNRFLLTLIFLPYLKVDNHFDIYLNIFTVAS